MLHTNFFNTEKNKTEIFYFFFYFFIVVMAVQCGLIVITPVHHMVYEMLPSTSKLEGWAIAEIVCATLSILLYQLIYRLVGGYNERKKVAPGWVIVLLGCTYGAIVRQESWYDGWDPTNVALILRVLFLWFSVFAIILFISHQSSYIATLMIISMLAVVAGVPVTIIQAILFIELVLIAMTLLFEVAAADE